MIQLINSYPVNCCLRWRVHPVRRATALLLAYRVQPAGVLIALPWPIAGVLRRRFVFIGRPLCQPWLIVTCTGAHLVRTTALAAPPPAWQRDLPWELGGGGGGGEAENLERRRTDNHLRRRHPTFNRPAVARTVSLPVVIHCTDRGRKIISAGKFIPPRKIDFRKTFCTVLGYSFNTTGLPVLLMIARLRTLHFICCIYLLQK